MSYILDALKRSEQERHQGELTHATIDTIMLKAKPVKHHWWPYLLIAVLVLNICVYGYFQISKGSLADDQSELELSAQKPLVQSEDQEEGKLAVVGQTNTPARAFAGNSMDNDTESTVVKPLPAHVLQTPSLNKYYDLQQNKAASQQAPLMNKTASPTETSARLPEFRSKTEFNEAGFEVIRPKQGSMTQKSRAETAPQTQNLADAKLQNYSNIKENRLTNNIASLNDIPENYELIEPARAINLAAQMPVQATEKSAAVTQLDRFESIQHLNDMPQEFQAGIPDIRFNSHIYSDRPAERRVIINDLYLKEGQGFSGLKIVTIGEFYIELEKQGQAFKLPVLRDWFRPN